MNWLLLPTLAGYGLAIIGFVGWWHNADKDHSAYWRMETERDEARTQRDSLNTENANLSEALEKTRVLYNNILAQNADLREALQEAQAEIKALQMNTIEVPEVAPEPVKRTRKKASTT